MLLYNYFLEIKNRIFLISFCWCSVFLVSYFYKETLLFLFVKLNIKAEKITSFYFITTNLTDVLNTYLNISYFVSTQITFVIILYQCMLFISAGLFVTEYKKIKFILFILIIFAMFSFYILNVYVIIHIWDFFLSFTNESVINSINIFFEAKITEYIQFYKLIYYLFIFFSQVFGIVFLILYYSDDKVNLILKTRKIIYLLFLSLSTIMTPSDVFSQIVIMFGLVFLFEVLIIFVLFSFKNLKIIIII